MFSIEGNIVNNGLQERGRIEIDTVTGLIVDVSDQTGTADVILKDELIFPGFVDIHVHAREDVSHTQDYKEDFATAGEAAIHGGVVAFADMPNNVVPPIDDVSYENKNKLTKKSAVPVLLYAGIGEETVPLSKKVPYKVFMGHSVGDLFFTSRKSLEHALAKYRGESVSFHSEDPEVLERSVMGETHEDRRPKEAEIAGVDFALELIEKYDLTGKICHISTIEGVQKINEAKMRGVKVTVEVTPHHLYFDESMITPMDKTKFQVNPPIRQTKENRLALVKALKHGEIDYLATDHAPHTIKEKQNRVSGLTHLDTYGSFVTWLAKEHHFTAKDIERVCAHNPGNFVNQFLQIESGSYGKIEKNYMGSLTVLDMHAPVTVEAGQLKTKNAWSPFEGVTFPGSVVMTIVKGKKYVQ